MGVGEKVIRIGGGSAFWGDSSLGLPDLISRGQLQYLVFDYLSEVTLALLARLRKKDPQAGFIEEFIQTLEPHLETIQQQGIRVISNAGALNPAVLASRLTKVVQQQGLHLKVIAVTGDDLIDRWQELTVQGKLRFEANVDPKSIVTCNTYLGSQKIVAALANGADIVVCGRHADSSPVLAALIHEFGWSFDDWDRLASGSLAGHLIECGAQVTGGCFTDWMNVPRPDRIGYPIAECKSDGSFSITKPIETGGLVSIGTVSEQLVYEVGDPCDYRLPDVICDWSRVQLKSKGSDRVDVSGAKGRPAPADYKVLAMTHENYRLDATLYIGGFEALKKAQFVGKMISDRVEAELVRRGTETFPVYRCEYLGTSDFEVILRIVAVHCEPSALELLARELAPAATNLAPGVASLLGGRPQPRPLIHQVNAWLAKESSDTTAAPPLPRTRDSQNMITVGTSQPKQSSTSTLLRNLAWVRSGDKGSSVNIGVIARKPEYLPYIQQELNSNSLLNTLIERVQGFSGSKVKIYEWPGISALNFLIEDALGDGGLSHLAIDAQGKTYASMLMDLPIPIPKAIAKEIPT